MLPQPEPSALPKRVESLRALDEPQLEQVRLDAQARGDVELEVAALWHLGGRRYHQADFHGCLKYNERAWAACQGRPVDYLLRMDVLNGLALAKKSLGLYDESLDDLLESLKLAQGHADTSGHLRAVTNIAMLHLVSGEAEEALPMYLRGLRLAREAADAISESACLCGLASTYLHLKRYQEVVDLTAQHLPFIQAHSEPGWLGTLMAETSYALLQLGRPQEALSTCQHARQHLVEADDPQARLVLTRTEGTILLHLGHPQEVVRLCLERLPALRENRDIKLLGEYHKLLSRAFRALGEHGPALEHFEEYFQIQEELRRRDLRKRSPSLTAQLRMELLEREAELERLRNVELVEANRVLQEAQRQLLYQATHDALTGVLNRSAFLTQAQNMLDDLPPGECAAMLFIDVDHFKSVNDAYGHHVGDELLQQIALRLRNRLERDDVIGRMGGDEFMVCIPHLRDASSTRPLAERINAALAEPFHLAGQRVEITVSVGFTSTHDDSLNAETLQRHADMAMYHVKRQGRHNTAAYRHGMSADLQRRQQLEVELRGVEGRGELLLHYQGCFNVQSGTLAGFEALLRWAHPVHGLIPPHEFIPLAEDTRLILPIGQWVLREACTQAVTWQLPARGINMAVNVSALQFEQPDFVQQVRHALDSTGLPARHLILELTESLVLRDLHLAQRHSRALQDLGVQIALDDFGTGYSSLSALHTLPFSHLKIDHSFLKAQQEDQAAPRLMLKTMIQMAHHLNMTVTAEGVEEESHLALLRDLRCDQGQGFFLAHPEPAQAAQRHLPPPGAA